MPASFQTLATPVEIAGVGLHCGKSITARLLPSEKLGVVFARVDLPGAPIVRAEVGAIIATTHATTIAHGSARVSTIEHLLAALWAGGWTHVRVELDGPEVPILDGSARGWVELLGRAGRHPLAANRPIARLQRPVWWEGGGAQMFGLPLPFDGSATFRCSVGVDFGADGARAQTFDGVVNVLSLADELAAARTFTLQSWLEPLRAAGLIKGGSLDNAILIGSDGAPSSPFRFENELARHKALDCVGDLALGLCASGALFHGHIVALRAGHGAHQEWLARALADGALEIGTTSMEAP